jgi:putative ABC transport system permease protein
MLKNYLTIALRFIGHNRIYTLINIIGFSIGISACLFIVLWIRDEISYDRFHSSAGRIHRILLREESRIQPRTPHPLAQQMVSDFPEVENAVTMSPLWGPGLTRAEYSVRYETVVFDEQGIFSVDTTFFEVFDFPFLMGDPKTALRDPMCILLTREMAVKYFGSVENALGKSLRINNNTDFTVNAIVENVPRNSHFTFDFLISYVTMKQVDRSLHNGELSDYYTWRDFGHYNYILLKEGADPREVEKKLNNWVLEQQFIPIGEAEIEKVTEGSIAFVIQPMLDIHLRSNIMWELGTNGNILYVYIFATAALLILVIACVNFLNLSTARSLKRAKEVGVRKAMGGSRNQLVIQFLLESVLLTLMAAFLSVVIVDMALPVFNNITGKSLSLGSLIKLPPAMVFIGGVLLVGVATGSYPAFFLSSFIPYEVLKGKIHTGASALTLRKALVIFQFVISIFLITSTLLVFKQLTFLRNQPLGFEKEMVLVVPMKDGTVREKYPAIRSLLLSDKSIQKVAASSSIPGGQFNQNSIQPGNGGEAKPVAELFVTADFFSLLGIHTLAGRVFSDEFRGDSASSFVINEAAARLLNLENPVDQPLVYYGDVLTNARGKIIGLVKDFNIHSLHQPAEPLIMILGDASLLTYVLIKIDGSRVSETIRFIEKTWKEFDAQHTFTWTFLDEAFNEQYAGEERLGVLFRIFAILALVIAALGLFGLSSFMIEQRTREIGLRKVYGAGITGILGILLRQFSTWVMIAGVVGIPLGLAFCYKWLENFAYKTTLSAWIFLAALLITLFITVLTVVFQLLRAARMNPVDILKEE